MIVALAVLAVLYWWPGDSTLPGEIVTIWPPELWAAVFAVIASLVGLADRRSGMATLAAVLVFVLATSEWLPLMRSRTFDGDPAPPGSTRLRLVTWNVARSPDLAALEPLRPDVCLFQESAPVRGQAALSPHWSGFHWAGTLDPAVFSRYPLETVEMAGIGPWAPPQAVVLDLPSGVRILVVNVRLVLPGIVRKLASPGDAIDLRSAHAERILQFRRLGEGVAARRASLGRIPAVVCGDFNTSARAASVRALHPLADIWPRAGRGWGGTMGADLPIARIDQCWTSEGVVPLQAWVERGRGSDHRLLVADLLIGGPDSFQNEYER